MASTVTRDSIMGPNRPRISSKWRCIRCFPLLQTKWTQRTTSWSVGQLKSMTQPCKRSLTSNGITVNPDKCVFDVEEVRFVGLVFNEHGIKPDPKNVRNLQDASQPTSKAELSSFLGMAGFSERVIPNFASIVHLCRKSSKRTSGPETESAKKHSQSCKPH